MSTVLEPAQAAARLVDSLGAAELARNAAYTRGEELQTVLGVAIYVLIALVLVRTRVLERIWDKLQPLGWKLATFVLGALFFLASDLLRLPWTILTDWKREKDFGLTRQPLGDFLQQNALESLVTSLFAALFITGTYFLIRRIGKSWWIWTGGFTLIVTSIMLLLYPALIQPLFNDFQPVPQGPVRTVLERIADRSGIRHDRIFMYDGSRQSEYFTANVAGIGPSARIAISDVALRRASLGEVEVVTAHEAGHYVEGHVWRHIAVIPALTLLVLYLLSRLFAPAARLLGSRAQLGDPVGMPVFMALVSCLSLLALPVTNTLTRQTEAQADRYALETTGRADDLASALLKTAEYRNPRPGWLEEVLFYNHPSVERRIEAVMAWKATHQAAGSSGPN